MTRRKSLFETGKGELKTIVKNQDLLCIEESILVSVLLHVHLKDELKDSLRKEILRPISEAILERSLTSVMKKAVIRNLPHKDT